MNSKRGLHGAVLMFAAAAMMSIDIGVTIAATGRGGPDAMKVVHHVRSLDKHDAFRLRERIGGAFYLGGAYCENPAAMPLLCKYNATQIATDASGKRTFCTIDVKVTRRGARHTHWHRWVEACATDFRPAPPTG